MKKHQPIVGENKFSSLLGRITYQLYHNILPTLLIIVAVSWGALVASNTIVTAKNSAAKASVSVISR